MIKFGTGGWRCLTLASDSKCSNLAAATAALVAFRIGLYGLSRPSAVDFWVKLWCKNIIIHGTV